MGLFRGCFALDSVPYQYHQTLLEEICFALMVFIPPVQLLRCVESMLRCLVELLWWFRAAQYIIRLLQLYTIMSNSTRCKRIFSMNMNICE